MIVSETLADGVFIEPMFKMFNFNCCVQRMIGNCYV